MSAPPDRLERSRVLGLTARWRRILSGSEKPATTVRPAGPGPDTGGTPVGHLYTSAQADRGEPTRALGRHRAPGWTDLIIERAEQVIQEQTADAGGDSLDTGRPIGADSIARAREAGDPPMFRQTAAQLDQGEVETRA